jgi:acetoin utilization protein AcuB
MKKPPLLKAIMTPFPFAIGVDEPIIAARKLMLEHHVRHLPVIRHGELAGIITDRDIKLVLGPEFDYPNPRELTVEDAYVDHGYAVDINTPLEQVLGTMADRHIGAALVTRKDRLFGIFTMSDACRAFSEFLRANDVLPDDAA